MVSKKSMEEEGTRFSMKNILFVIGFLVIVAVIFILINSKMAPGSVKDTLSNFMVELLRIGGGE